jgi:uncharacterized protein YndB with AHSA1/START domain
MSTTPSSGDAISLERHYQATLEEVWALWTTKDGIEAWWGPDGFSVTVQQLDLRVDGELRYTMTATAAAQIEFMQQAGMPLATEVTLVYTEVEVLRRLSYKMAANFIPHVEPYDSTTTVSFEPDSGGVHMVLTFSALHDDEWTQRAVQGHQSELERLDAILSRQP